MSSKQKMLVLLAITLLLLGLLVAWRYGVETGAITVEAAISRMRLLGSSSNPIFAVMIIILASILAVPLGVIIAVCAVVFGPWTGLLHAMLGACTGGSISFLLGRYLGHDALRQMAGERVNRLSVALGNRGILSVILLRMMPIAPFAIANMVAGTTHIRFRDFLLGSVVGMLPGGVMISLLSVEAFSLIDMPADGGGLMIVAVLGAIIVLGAIAGRRGIGWIVRTRIPPDES